MKDGHHCGDIHYLHGGVAKSGSEPTCMRSADGLPSHYLFYGLSWLFVSNASASHDAHH